MTLLSRIYARLKKVNRGDYNDIGSYRRKSIFLRKLSQKIKMNSKKRIRLAKSVTLSDAQTAEIKELFKRTTGKNISTLWHRYYQSISGKYDKNYIPELLFSEMEFLGNDRSFATAFSDKLFQHRFFSDLDYVRIPQIAAYIKDGIWYSADGAVIGIDKVAELFAEKGTLFAKPIRDTSSGKGCHIVKISGGIETKSRKSVADYLHDYSDNYLFEELIVNSKSVSALHPMSVNTFRVMSYILDGEVYTCPVFIRIGRNKSEVDNAHAGGLIIAVDNNGMICAENSVTEFNERMSSHPDTHIVFKGYKIESFEKVLSAVRKMHRLIPELKIVSWDITIDENENVVLIEINTRDQGSWAPQMAHGVGIFGENTEKILSQYKSAVDNIL